MIIYKCRFTGDEMCSDAFKPGPVTDSEGKAIEGLMQIQSQKVNKVSDVSVDGRWDVLCLAVRSTV